MSSALEEDALMPIAIIGIAGRFPGEASNPEKLWGMIAAGRNALTEVPKDRFNIDAFYHPHGERQGTMNVRGGNFLQGDISAFDAPFFSITPKEANAMDPQQRMALEVAYESIENGESHKTSLLSVIDNLIAGLRMEDVVGSKTSCYIASFSKDYSGLRAHDSEDIPSVLLFRSLYLSSSDCTQ
jgi:acyl transferase domain-containing protein